MPKNVQEGSNDRPDIFHRLDKLEQKLFLNLLSDTNKVNLINNDASVAYQTVDVSANVPFNAKAVVLQVYSRITTGTNPAYTRFRKNGETSDTLISTTNVYVTDSTNNAKGIIQIIVVTIDSNKKFQFKNIHANSLVNIDLHGYYESII